MQTEDAISVSSFTVCRGVPVDVDGMKVLSFPLSPAYSNVELAKQVLPMYQEEYPDAKIWQLTFFHYGDMSERDQYVQQLSQSA